MEKNKLYAADGTPLKIINGTIPVSKLHGKPWLILDEAGKPLSTEEVADIYDLPLTEKGRPSFRKNRIGISMPWDYNPTTGELVVSAVIPDNIDTTYDYLKDLDQLSDTKLNSDKETELARLLYDNEGICTGVIDVLVENSVTGGYVSIPVISRKKSENEHLSPDKEKLDQIETARILCEVWMQYVNNFEALDPRKKSDEIGIVGAIGGLDSVLSQGSLCYYRDGDWVATQTWAKIKIPQLGKAFNLPIRITTHDKASLSFDETAAQMGLRIIEWKVPDDIKTLVKNGPRGDKTKKVIFDTISDELKKRIKSGEDKIPLPPDRTTHLKRCGEDWKANGHSYLRSMMHVLADKNRIRRMDRATVIGNINQLVFLMLGSDDKDSPHFQPEPQRFRLFKNALTNMRTMSWILWNGWDIKIDKLSPDPTILNFADKYKEVNSDLWISGRVPRILIDGQGSGNSERDWAAFAGIMNKLNLFRLFLKSWVETILQNIMIENNIKDIFPVYTQLPMGLRNQRDIWQVVNNAFTNGLLGRRDSLHELGKNPDAFITNQLKEADEKLNDILLPPKTSHTQGGGRPVGIPDGGGQEKRTSKTDENTTTAICANEDFEIRLRDTYNIMVSNIVETVGQEKDKRKIISFIMAGFGAFLGVTNDIIKETYVRMAPKGENRWGLELEMWNNGYVQRFSTQTQSTIQAFLGAFERGEITEDILLFQIKTYLSSQSYRIPMYAEEIPSKIELAIKLESLGIEKHEYVRPRTVGDEYVCDECRNEEQKGTVMTLSEFFAMYPLHPRGRCYPEPVPEYNIQRENLSV